MKAPRRMMQMSFFVILLAATAWAADPPGRVARLQYISGQISVQPHGTDDWVQAEANRPLTNTDNIWADKDSRAELNLATGQLRINSETSLTLTNVNNDAVQVSLHQGTLNVHVRHLYGGEIYEIDTPNLAFTVSKSGEYRFDVDPNADTTVVTVWKGEGEATGQGSGVRIRSGEQARFSGGNSLAHDIHQAPHPDGFDEWCQVRDKREDHSISARYVAPGVVGSEDLDDNGTWRETREYGPVWVPSSVSSGWAPYSYGHWAWIDPWGWTWVDDYPWGFAPFHYGRWVSWEGSWGWAPGPYYVRPWYAPALVAWFGGPGWGVSFGFGFGGGFGWCPLGFGEPFFPWYGASPFYFRNVNVSNTRITNITNITNNYFNNNGNAAAISPYGRHGIAMPRFANKPGAITAISRTGLEHGTPIRGNSVRVTPKDLTGATTLAKLNANPTRESILGARTGQTAARPSQTAFSRPTVSRMNPPSGSARSGAGQTMSHNTGATMTHGPEAPVTHAGGPAPAHQPERQVGSMPAPAPGNHYVPRPPQSLSSSNRPADHTSGGGTTFSRNVPKPPSADGVTSRTGTAQTAWNHPASRPQASSVRPDAGVSGRVGASNNSASPISHSVPRPPAGALSRPTVSAHDNGPSRSMGSGYSSPRSAPNSVPRPTGRVMPAPHNSSGSGSWGGHYSAPSRAGGDGYSSRSYGAYGSNRGYSSPNYGGSYGARGGVYSAPSHSSGGYGGYHGSSGSPGSSGAHSSGGSSHGGMHR